MKKNYKIIKKLIIVLYPVILLFVLPTLSAAQGKIVFSSNRDGNFEIYSMNPDGTNQTRLTNNSAADKDPSISADGLKIAFTSTRNGNSEIFITDAEGSNHTQLTFNSGGAFNQNPSFSPDGTKIVFDRYFSGLQSGTIFTINATGGNLIQLTFTDQFIDEDPA